MRKMTLYLATGLAEGFEEGSEEEQVRAWQFLVDTGLAWSLQGRFGRTAAALIQKGVINRLTNLTRRELRMIDPLIEIMVAIKARGKQVDNSNLFKCDFEGCPGRISRAKKKLIWSPTYLFVHAACMSGARQAARERHEVFGFRSGI